MCGQRLAQAVLPPRKALYPLRRRLGGTQGRSGRLWKVAPPLGFDARTVQPVANAIPTPTTGESSGAVCDYVLSDHDVTVFWGRCELTSNVLILEGY